MVYFKMLIWLVFFYGFFEFVVCCVVGCDDNDFVKAPFEVFLHVFAPVGFACFNFYGDLLTVFLYDQVCVAVDWFFDLYVVAL